MQKASIPHDALVFVGDGTRALFLRNRGTIQKPGAIHLRPMRAGPQGRPPISSTCSSRSAGSSYTRMAPARSSSSSP